MLLKHAPLKRSVFLIELANFFLLLRNTLYTLFHISSSPKTFIYNNYATA